MLRDWFDDQMTRMQILKHMPADMSEHFKGLQDIPAPVLDEGISHAIKTRVWFPTVAELRADCDAARGARPVAVHPTSRLVPVEGSKTVHIANPFGGKGITVQVTKEPDYECEGCDDTGWAKFWCGASESTRMPWMTRGRCNRREPHFDHDWTDRCRCVATNSRIQERRAAQAAKYSQDPEKISA